MEENVMFHKDLIEKYSVVKIFLTTASDIKKYNILYYNLDMIVAIRFRVRI